MIITILLVFALVLALASLELKNLWWSLISFGLCGAAICMVLVLLKTPEPGFIKLAIELALLFFLLRKTTSQDASPNADPFYWLALTLLVLFGFYLNLPPINFHALPLAKMLHDPLGLNLIAILITVCGISVGAWRMFKEKD